MSLTQDKNENKWVGDDSIGSGNDNNNYNDNNGSDNDNNHDNTYNDNENIIKNNNRKLIGFSVAFESEDYNSISSSSISNISINKNNDEDELSSLTVEWKTRKKKEKKKKKKSSNTNFNVEIDHPFSSISEEEEEEEEEDHDERDDKNVTVLPVLPVLPHNENVVVNSNNTTTTTCSSNGNGNDNESGSGSDDGSIYACNIRSIIKGAINDDQSNSSITFDKINNTKNNNSNNNKFSISSSSSNSTITNSNVSTRITSNAITSIRSNNNNNNNNDDDDDDVNTNVNVNVNTKIDNEPDTYPADVYSILSLHGPFESYFYFGLMVYLFQMTFLLLMVLSVVHPVWASMDDVDNPTAGRRTFFQQIAQFVPSQVSPLVRATQIIATLAYTIFADSTIRDVVLGVELFPCFKQTKSDDKVGCMVFSSILRLSQGIAAVIVTLFLIVSTSNVIDIILNFTAINYISNLDDLGFEVIKWGKYGTKFKQEANRIETLPLPRCISKTHNNKRYVRSVIPIGVILMAVLCIIIILQEKNNVWVTEIFRVQFQNKEQGFQRYNGCYKMNETAIGRNDGYRRKLYEGSEYNSESAKFGYCMDERRWILLKVNGTRNIDDVCEAGKYGHELARSSKTDTFDVSTMFGKTWYSSSNTPLDVYFFEDNEIDENTCSSFLDDGNCDSIFNTVGYLYDGGDCCAATCSGSNCGIGSLKNAFGTTNKTGDGFPDCLVPGMVPITIRLDNILNSFEPQFLKENDIPVGFSKNSTIDEILENPDASQRYKDFFAKEPVQPFLLINCDKRNVLNINVDKSMENHTETIMVNDGADCTITIKNTTSGNVDPIWFVNYTIFYGDRASLGSEQIVVAQSFTAEDRSSTFKMIPNCYFDKLYDYIDKSTVYAAIDYDPSAKAIDWLMSDESENSSCDNSLFLERYALAAIYFNTLSSDDSYYSNSSWIRKTRQCVWPSITCENGAVVNLNLDDEGLTGSIQRLVSLFELLTSLKSLALSSNQLTGSIPSEIGLMSSLEFLYLDENYLTGSIPSEVTSLASFDPLYVENQKCMPCDVGYSRRTDTKNTNDGNYSCSALLLELDRMPMDVCAILKDECIICVEIKDIREFLLTIIQPVALQDGAEFEDPNSYQLKALARIEEQNDIATLPRFKIIQYYALYSIYMATNGTGWIVNDGWDQTTIYPCDGWFGIECEDDIVTVIDLYSNNLTGAFPPEVTLLASDGKRSTGAGKLSRIDVYDNVFLTNNGDNTWWSQLGSNFVHLFFKNTAFSGSLARLPENIKEFDCSFSSITGGLIDSNFDGLNSLRYANFDGNAYNSTVPLSFSSLPNLDSLYIVDGFISGDLSYMIDMPAMKEHWVDNNPNLGGSLPTEIAMVETLESFSISSCSFSGTIPTEFGDFFAMRQMWMYNNSLSGTIPSQLADLDDLRLLRIEGNAFTGSMPAEICNNTVFPLEVLGADCYDENFSCDCCTCCSVEECPV